MSVSFSASVLCLRCEALLSEGELTALRAEHTGDDRPPRGCQQKNEGKEAIFRDKPKEEPVAIKSLHAEFPYLLL